MIMTWNLYLNFDIMKSKLKFQPQNCDMNGGLFSVNETTNSGNKTLLNSIQFTTSASILIDFCLVRRLIVIWSQPGFPRTPLSVHSIRWCRCSVILAKEFIGRHFSVVVALDTIRIRIRHVQDSVVLPSSRTAQSFVVGQKFYRFLPSVGIGAQNPDAMPRKTRRRSHSKQSY